VPDLTTVSDLSTWSGPWGEPSETSLQVKNDGVTSEILGRYPTEDVDILVTRVPPGIESAVVLSDDEIPEEVWVWDREHARRDEDGFYILHKDEFYQDERDYTQTTLTYYAGDDILVDQESVPIYNYTTIIGELRFGHGSDSESIFYVRNNKLKAEYEIVCDDGKYSVEILGLEAEEEAEQSNGLKHTRFRED
jgi:hypothetical protein